MAKKKETSKSKLVGLRVTPEELEWLKSRPGGHSKYLHAVIEKAMSEGGSSLPGEEHYEANFRKLIIYENYGYIGRHFENYEAYESFMREAAGVEPDFDPFLDMKLDDIANYPEEYTGWMTVDLNMFVNAQTVGTLIEVWSDEWINLGLVKGDLVLADTHIPVADGCIAIAWQKNEFHFKSISKEGDIWKILPDEEKLTEQTWENWKADYCYGVAVGKFGKLPYPTRRSSKKFLPGKE